MQELDLLCSAVQAALNGQTATVPALEEEAWRRVCALAKAHDLSLPVFEGLSGTPLPDGVTQTFLRHSAATVSRFYAQEAAAKRLYAAFAENGVDYMPLKGSLLRELYPVPEWRTGRDVDVLIRPAALERARAVAIEVLQPVKVTEGYHDVGLETADGARIELHFALFNGDEGFGDLLCDPFAHAVANGHCYRQTDAALYAYHVAHMAKHFRHGGCGLRAFLDLSLLCRRMSEEAMAQASKLLTTAGLAGFERAVRRLAAVLFEGAQGDEETRRLARFVAENKAFGSVRSQAAAGHRAGKHSLLSRIFPPYRIMSRLYPVLRKCPLLLPCCWVLRGFRIFSKKERARFLAASRAAVSVNDNDVAELAQLYQYLQLEG